LSDERPTSNIERPTLNIEKMPLIRLQKYLSQAGYCSRRKGERHIVNGDVTVNGEVATQLGIRVNPVSDRVAVCGQPITARSKRIYIALNKPAGYISSCKHANARIVLDLIDIRERIYPVGRLDKDSTGLLLLTNDGALHQQLSHPSNDHEKEYEVTVARPISDGALRKMAAGLRLNGVRTRAAKIKRTAPQQFRIILQEGRNRQIRRMVAKVGSKVVRLKRIRIANLKLGRLQEGRWRHLTDAEKTALIKPERKRQGKLK